MDGVGYEVRGTPRADGHLIIHKPDKSNDRPETPFVLVTGRPPTFTPTDATHGAPPAARGWTPCRSAPVPWNRDSGSVTHGVFYAGPSSSPQARSRPRMAYVPVTRLGNAQGAAVSGTKPCAAGPFIVKAI